MTYELAKQLKDAGYLFTKVQPFREIVRGKQQIDTGVAFDGVEYYAPTLLNSSKRAGMILEN